MSRSAKPVSRDRTSAPVLLGIAPVRLCEWRTVHAARTIAGPSRDAAKRRFMVWLLETYSLRRHAR
jgi:hypothetical protein